MSRKDDRTDMVQRKHLQRAFRRRVAVHIRIALFFSLCINLLLLVSPIYMLQVYDRILVSGAYDTLLWITLIATFLLAVYATAEAARRRVFALAAVEIGDFLSDRIFCAFYDRDLLHSGLTNDVIAMRRLQAGIQGGLFAPFFDAPFAPLFLVLLFMVHPILGWIGLIGAAVLLLTALFGQAMSRSDSAEAQELETLISAFMSGASRQRSAIVSMGIGPEIERTARKLNEKSNKLNLNATAIDGVTAGVSRALRQGLQILVLGVGGFLALQQEVSAGAIVAGSIFMGRALGPIDQVVSGWRQLSGNLLSWRRLLSRLDGTLEKRASTPLPRPKASLAIDSVSVASPGMTVPLVKPFSFTIDAPKIVTLLGANGSGKTSFLQILAGAWPAPTGQILWDGRDLHAWPSEDRGAHVGYLPQGIELLPGTVIENISRFRIDARPDDVYETAWRVGSHQSIVGLPDGYDTRIGPGGVPLSSGQAQLIGLARAFMGEPVLLILDEPTAHLDVETAPKVISAICEAKRRGAIVIVSTHDVRLIRQSDLTLALKDGTARLGSPASILQLNTPLGTARDVGQKMASGEA